MDFPQENRGRPLSTDNKNRSLNPSPSPQPQYHDNQGHPLGHDPAGSVFPGSNTFTTANEHFPITTPYLASSAHDTNFLHSTGAQSSEPQPFGQPQPYSQSFEAGFLSQLERSSNIKAAQEEENFSNLLNSNQPQFEDFPIYNNNNPTSDFDSSFMLDPQLNQQQQQQQQQHINQSVNPADLSRMSSPHNQTPPLLIPPDSHASPGRPSSPVSNPGAYFTPGHSRPASLDPASAAFLTSQSQSDWHGMLGNPIYQTHRRAPSEHSDVSSVAPSPYLGHHDTFDVDTNNHSPLLLAQNDPGLYENALGMEAFSISDQAQHHGISPAHSPYISPRLLPQQHGPELGQDGSFHLTQHVKNQLGPTSPPDMYVSRSEASPAPATAFQSHNSPGDMGQAAQMTPPSINVEFAPPSRTTSFGPAKPETDMDTLSPPVGRSRGRSKSDPFGHAVTRPMSSPTTAALAQGASSPSRSLSPFNGSTGNLSTPASRDTSPAAAKNRRQSTSSIDSRNYILDLADPQRPGASSADSKRVQKHPATFQCSLCPKRFTRAYNLRSHLRTHTDERPFVCTVCGKAFARQHDRKRHESLHSGEKKFVCRGDLAHGAHWGCGRRFARADALGRHFRSEAGRVCIKPLMDEEALERERTYVDQQQMHGHLQPISQPMNIPPMDGQPSGFTLPAALLAQYPALQTLQWDQLAPHPDDGSDIGGGGGARSNYDASSGGEYGFGDDDDSGLNSGYVSGSGQNFSHAPPSQDQMMGVPSTGSGWG
ncbi:C2H2 zinc finger domain-containing protein [Histoplasma capsulatum G186AR]|uniref:C2H2 zinc finger domain-containing protein n=2 Tax=Ajellomyces capsulatus TaxID=5037 RepID=C0NGD4_AJECG|nr:C2H2 zinc finger domain-containing protein [Histoplasma capsulatum G186AR]EEH08869.1 C2H2 zinc finger domain-containing protein [Histoplasma capsulatum G186AR]KAG5303814.1 C2H2 zinc finger domain-containing protein [Histoplasma capsulatum]QSS69412.1 C2H2 zinc finger domain-containing protein [Histoplasma capsulatum G186AR]